MNTFSVAVKMQIHVASDLLVLILIYQKKIYKITSKLIMIIIILSVIIQNKKCRQHNTDNIINLQ